LVGFGAEKSPPQAIECGKTEKSVETLPAEGVEVVPESPFMASLARAPVREKSRANASSTQTSWGDGTPCFCRARKKNGIETWSEGLQ
jgi:hypothetical protein